MGFLKRFFEAFAAASDSAPSAAASKPSPGVLSGDLLFKAATRRPLAELEQIAFQRRAPIPSGVSADGTTGMDSSDWGGGSTLKSAYAIGSGDVSEALFGWFTAQSFIGYQMCAVLSQHWLIEKACRQPAEDATRAGYEITANSGQKIPPEVFDHMRTLDERFRVREQLCEALENVRRFGVRIVLFNVESADPNYYEKPFNPDGVTAGSYLGMSQIDPYWITPELDEDAAANPASAHFYEPTFWRIAGKRYHRTHLVVLRRGSVPDVLKPTYFYGGFPLPQQIYERVYSAERTANEAPQLAMTKRLTVLSGVDIMAAAGNQKDFADRMAMWAYFRDNYGVKICGGTETVTQFDTGLADLDETIMTQFQLVCAIAETPATKLLGTSPKGFNATGTYDESSYHEFLESLNAHQSRPIMERHHLLCMRSYVSPKFGIAPFATSIEFEKLDSETAKERADRIKAESDADKQWADAGAIDGLDIRNRLIKDRDGPYTGIEAAEPEGPRPNTVVDPSATKTEPNNPTEGASQ